MNQTTTASKRLKLYFFAACLLCGFIATISFASNSLASTNSATNTSYLPIIFNDFPPDPKLESDKSTVNTDSGECATVSWDFTGAVSVEINRGKGFMKRAAPVAGSMLVCPSTFTVYEATAVYGGRTVTLQTAITVTGRACNRDPYVHQFNPTTTQVFQNEGITVTWDVRCSTKTFLQLNDSPKHRVDDFDQQMYTMFQSTYFQLWGTKIVNGTTVFDEMAAFGVTVRP